jgi:hypothetical protein
MKTGNDLREIRVRVPAVFAALAGASIALVASMPAQAIVSSVSSSDWVGSGVDYLDGVGELTLTRSDGTFGCSGSLIAGGQYVLTAAHCLGGEAGSATTSNISLSFMNGAVTASTDTYYIDSAWTGDLTAGNDLALIKLSTAITTISGYNLDLSSAQGATMVLAGYGFTGTGTTGSTSGTFGTLYYGENQYDAGKTYTTRNGYSSSVYLYDFDNLTGSDSVFGSTGLGASEALIAPGDSGGASLVYVNGQWELAGVHSFLSCLADGCVLNSTYGEIGGDVSVAGQSAWLLSYIAAVPEPHTWAMLFAGLGMVGGIARHRRRATGA